MSHRVHRIRMDNKGRLVVPLALREAMALRDGGELLLSVQDGALLGRPRLALLARIRHEVATLLPGGAALLDDMLAGRMSGHGR